VKIVVHLRSEAEDARPPDHRKGSEHTVSSPDSNPSQVDGDHPEVRPRIGGDGDAYVGISAIQLVALQPDDSAGDRRSERGVGPHHYVDGGRGWGGPSAARHDDVARTGSRPARVELEPVVVVDHVPERVELERGVQCRLVVRHCHRVPRRQEQGDAPDPGEGVPPGSASARPWSGRGARSWWGRRPSRGQGRWGTRGRGLARGGPDDLRHHETGRSECDREDGPGNGRDHPRARPDPPLPALIHAR
jgi:hypothetical protein